jgi:predicted enzyme related to lactoylglutathione lyase
MSPRNRLRRFPLLLAGLLAAGGAGPAGAQTPAVEGSVVMLYYRDIDRVAPFYEEVLGLPLTYAGENARLYRLHGGAEVGLVQEGPLSFHRVQPESAVMLSVVTDDVDAWYRRVRDAEGIEILKTPYDSDSNPIRAFLLRDPGGYTVEFFQWLAR